MITQTYIVGPGKLSPADFEATSDLATIPLGEAVEVVIYRRESDTPFSRLVYKTFNLVGAAMKWRARNVRGWLAVKTGRADLVAWPPGGVHKVMTIPHGTGPTEMSQAALEVFWDEAVEVIKSDVLPRVEPEVAEQIGWRIADLRERA